MDFVFRFHSCQSLTLPLNDPGDEFDGFENLNYDLSNASNSFAAVIWLLVPSDMELFFFAIVDRIIDPAVTRTSFDTI